jgi:hypothetical protein
LLIKSYNKNLLKILIFRRYNTHFFSDTGWQPFGLVNLSLAFLMAMFPRTLPRAAQRNVDAAAAKGILYSTQNKSTRSFAGKYYLL